MNMTWILLGSALAIALANGSNDNFKGVATLFGAGTASYRRALAWATVTTAAGSLTALLLAGSLVARFSGKGLVPDSITSNPAFLAAVGGGAAITVLIASAVGAPISTTHALLGALVGAGFLASMGALNLSALGGTFLLPLLASPLVAIGMVGVLHPVLASAVRRWEAGSGICICATEVDAAPAGTGTAAVMEARLPAAIAGSSRECAVHGLSPAVALPRSLDIAHYLSAGAVGFARGVNDTPKLVALLLPLPAVGATWGLPLIASAIAIGGVLGSRRIAQTMGHGITSMTPGHAFSANAVTAMLVLAASRFGLPVSTTHVATGSLFGLGAVTQGARWPMIRRIVLAWFATIPVAAALGAVLWLILRGR